ncbi:MAG TPA: glycosyltransferase family 4 protein [Candidatus Acidoferrum sp.]|nr:glycosyltransferase family 4 protein [Candidatus Acidoferrum sp.]
MKLLIYSHFFAPSIGGVETIVLSLAGGLAELRSANGAREFEVTVVTQTAKGDFDDGTLPFRVIRRPTFLQLLRLICSSDIVHVAGPALAPVFLGLFARRPVVIEHHGFQTVCPNGQLLIEPQNAPCPGHFMAGRHGECLRCNSGQGWLLSWKLWLLTFVRRFLSAQVSVNITPTQWLGGLLDLPRVTTVPHGLETGRVIHQAASSSHTPLIAFMGRLVTTKGTLLLLKAAKILQDQGRRFALLIIGEGPERSSLEQFVRDSQLAAPVRFAGRLYGDQLEAALARVAAVVVPSLGGEVFGLVVAENMLRGLPVVASDLGAFVEVLGGKGLVFRTRDASDLASALARLLDDPSVGVGLGQQARRRALQSFSFSHMIDAHVCVYRGLYASR